MSRNKLTKLLSAMVVAVTVVGSLTTTTASAYTTGWHKYGSDEGGAKSYYWYTKSDGSDARGWNYIDGVWYYFSPEGEGYVTVAGMCEPIEELNVVALDTGVPIDGQTYYFDREGRMIANTKAVLRSGVEVWIDANGHIR